MIWGKTWEEQADERDRIVNHRTTIKKKFIVFPRQCQLTGKWMALQNVWRKDIWCDRYGEWIKEYFSEKPIKYYFEEA